MYCNKILIKSSSSYSRYSRNAFYPVMVVPSLFLGPYNVSRPVAAAAAGIDVYYGRRQSHKIWIIRGTTGCVLLTGLRSASGKSVHGMIIIIIFDCHQYHCCVRLLGFCFYCFWCGWWWSASERPVANPRYAVHWWLHWTATGLTDRPIEWPDPSSAPRGSVRAVKNGQTARQFIIIYRQMELN